MLRTEGRVEYIYFITEVNILDIIYVLQIEVTYS